MNTKRKTFLDFAATIFFLCVIVIGAVKSSTLITLIGGIFLIITYLISIQELCSDIDDLKKQEYNEKLCVTFTAQQLSQIFGAMSVAEHEGQIEAEFCKEMDGLLDEILSIEDYDNNIVYKISKV